MQVRHSSATSPVKNCEKCLMCSWFLNCCFHFQHWTLKAYLQSSNNTITRCDRCNNEDFEHVSDANLGWVTPIFACQSFGKSGNPQPKWENMSLQGTGCKPIGKKLLYLAFVKSVSRFFSTSDCYSRRDLNKHNKPNMGGGKPKTFRNNHLFGLNVTSHHRARNASWSLQQLGLSEPLRFSEDEKQRQRYTACWQTSSSNRSFINMKQSYYIHLHSSCFGQVVDHLLGTTPKNCKWNRFSADLDCTALASEGLHIDKFQQSVDLGPEYLSVAKTRCFWKIKMKMKSSSFSQVFRICSWIFPSFLAVEHLSSPKIIYLNRWESHHSRAPVEEPAPKRLEGLEPPPVASNRFTPPIPPKRKKEGTSTQPTNCWVFERFFCFTLDRVCCQQTKCWRLRQRPMWKLSRLHRESAHQRSLRKQNGWRFNELGRCLTDKKERSNMTFKCCQQIYTNSTAKTSMACETSWQCRDFINLSRNSCQHKRFCLKSMGFFHKASSSPVHLHHSSLQINRCPKKKVHHGSSSKSSFWTTS